ncbi:MAG: hypothetical protein JW870_21285 [Candidatus Delongbacteria bacterium]|nr:hypothetical protein [Candidatus Delongbacteria bacterium]
MDKQITIPVTSESEQLIEIIENIKKIIQKIDFIFNEDKAYLLSLCDDSAFMLKNKTPKLFALYLSHSLRELIEKFIGKSNTVGTDTYFTFDKSIKESNLKVLDNHDKYKFVESRDDNKIKICNFIEKQERNELLRISIEETWHENIWRLNDTYANNDECKRHMGTKHFFKSIPAKYSISMWSYEELIKVRKELYRNLSKYAHGGDILKVVDILKKKQNVRNQEENKKLNNFLQANMAVFEIFRPFQYTTNEKIKQIDNLINE